MRERWIYRGARKRYGARLRRRRRKGGKSESTQKKCWGTEDREGNSMRKGALEKRRAERGKLKGGSEGEEDRRE